MRSPEDTGHPLLICGGGIAGLTLAILLKQQGRHLMVVERSPRRRGKGT